MKIRIAATLLILLLIFPLFGGFDAMQALGNRLAADGSLESYTPAVHFWVALSGLAAALFLAAMIVWSSYSPAPFIQFWHSLARAIPRFLISLWHDTKSTCRMIPAVIRRSRNQLPLLALIVFAGALIRILLVNRPMTHDEAYTVVTWGSGSMRYALSDYHLPNNHVFHTLLVNLIYHALGKTPMLVRLPALLSGILLIPAVYALGKSLYNAETGLFASALTAFSSFLIDYSTNARGYTLLVLCSVLIFIFGYYLLKRKNRFIWLCLILTTVIGFFTLPMMIYPFGALCLWMFFNASWDHFKKTDRSETDLQPYSSWINFMQYLIGCGIAVIFLTALCYRPILTHSGFQSMFGNVFVRPLPAADFFPTLKSRAIDFGNAFTLAMPMLIQGVLLLGNVIAFLSAFRSKDFKFPLQLSFILWLVPLWLIQRPNLWPRALIFLWPFLLIWGAAGIVQIISVLASRLAPRHQSLILSCALLLLTAVSAFPQISRTAEIAAEVSQHEQAVLEVARDPAIDEVLFAVAPVDDAALWYYADRYDLPKSLFDRNRPFSTVYVYVNPNNDGFEEPRDLAGVINRYGPGDSFIDHESIEKLRESDSAQLYRFKSNQRIIEETFGTSTKN